MRPKHTHIGARLHRLGTRLHDKKLARQAKTIEAHYGQPMDMEWARDGVT
ncbi:MAG: PEP/pyruvate-binding domain-containing protein, partial [Pseudomonadota bacterium]